jgi:hypothetical protein
MDNNNALVTTDDDNEEWCEEVVPLSYDLDRLHTGPLESAAQSPDE